MSAVHRMVSGIVPFDDLEADHRSQTLAWLEGTNDVYRRAKPATPQCHLVSYLPVVDLASGSTLLVDHVNGCRWLPPGGHVEPRESPMEAARREAREELGMEACFLESPPRPAFVTVTVTGGVDGHTDVSLWFPLSATAGMVVSNDSSEFTESRWWTTPEVFAAPVGTLDPHYERFIRKLDLVP